MSRLNGRLKKIEEALGETLGMSDTDAMEEVYLLFHWGERINQTGALAETPWDEMNSDQVHVVADTCHRLNGYLDRYGFHELQAPRVVHEPLKRNEDGSYQPRINYWETPDEIPLLAEQGFPQDQSLNLFWNRLHAYFLWLFPDLFKPLLQPEEVVAYDQIIQENAQAWSKWTYSCARESGVTLNAPSN